MRNYFLGLLSLSLCMMACDSDGNIKTTPSKPEAGQNVTINIPLKQTTLSDAENVYAYVYAIGATELKDTAIDVLLQKKDNSFVGEFTVPDSSLAIYMYLLDKNKIDDNKGKGYGFTLYKDGKELANSELYLISTTRRNSYYWNEYGFTPGLLADLKKTYDKNKNAYTTQDLIKYYNTYLSVREKVDTAYELSLLNTIAEATDLSEADAFKVKNYYKTLGDSSKNEVLAAKIKEYQPASNTASDLVWDLYSLPTAKEKTDLFQKYLDTLTADPYTGKGVTQNLAYYTAIGLLNEGKTEQALSYTKYFQDKGFTNSIQSQIVDKLTEPSYKLTAKDITLLNSIVSDQSEGDFKRVAVEDYYKSQKSKLSNADYNKVKKAKIFAKQNQADSAYLIFGSISKNDALAYYAYGNSYFNLLIADNKIKEAVDLWKEMKVKSFSDEDIDKTLESKLNENAVPGVTWASLQESLTTEVKEKSRENISAHFTNIPAPKFQLTDLDGNPFNMDQYKGKKLMIDFWATWCGPCIASFPEMAQLQEHFAKADTTVQFLFVLTMEDGKKEEEVIASAKKLMESKNLNFLILNDISGNYVNQFQISAIPCKVFVDKNGNFRYKSTGYMRGYEKNLSDFETIFSLMEK
jgi:thiol-disulfide isomerase/thioredoxin